jgi:sec-independent protein translocase protein TatA
MAEYTQYTLAFTWGWNEWLIILVIALIIFGGRKLPELARSLGKSLSEFKKGIREAKEDEDELADDIRKVKDDIVNNTKDAAGLNDLDKSD